MATRSEKQPQRRLGRTIPALLAVLLLSFQSLIQAQTPVSTGTPAVTVPLVLPRGLAYDSHGTLFFAETGSHRIRSVSPDGILTTFAGTGTQGFAGDGGPAIDALLDSPTAVLIDPAGNLILSDAHNHRVRRVDAATGVITTIAGTGTPGLSPDGTLATAARVDLPSALALDAAQNLFFADARTNLVRRIDHVSGLVTTVAGNGTQGFSGDGGLALAAAIDTPWGLAIDSSGDLFLADTHNQRVRRVDHITGVITSSAGNGRPGFSGDSASAIASALNLPRGLTIDSSGNLFVVDARNHRVRRIDAVTGVISTIAGEGTQAFAGDAQAASSASLDTPFAAALSPTGLLVFSDSANQRVRAIDSAAILHTVAGLAPSAFTRLTLSAPAVLTYGTGSVAATFVPGGAAGLVTFLDTFSGVVQTFPAIALSGNVATLDISTFAAGDHRLSASYSGDSLHPAAQSSVLGFTISPASLLVTPTSIQLLYGQPIPTLTGSLSGLLPQDAASVVLTLTSTAVPLATPARFPISASISGPAAGNYVPIFAPAFVSVAKAASAVTLSDTLAVHVSSSTIGTPGGGVTLLDGGAFVTSTTLSATGDAVFSSATLSSGSHTLTATYPGNIDFLAATSAPAFFSAGSAPVADFTLAATSPNLLSIAAGTPAVFNFTVSPVNGALSSPILLTAIGLPTGATTSFNPTYLPPSSTDIAFTLTVQTAKSALLMPQSQPLSFAWAALLPLAFFVRRRCRKDLYSLLLSTALLTGALGCGDRTTHTTTVSSARTSIISVLATATTTTGATLQHTTTVTLITQ